MLNHKNITIFLTKPDMGAGGEGEYPPPVEQEVRTFKVFYLLGHFFYFGRTWYRQTKDAMLPVML